MSMALVILAAGQGTRMNSDLPKVLHPIGGAPMLVHAIRSGEVLEPARIVVVTGHGGEAVARAAADYQPGAEIVVQEDRLGTAHAVAQAEGLEGFSCEDGGLALDGWRRGRQERRARHRSIVRPRAHREEVIIRPYNPGSA